MITDVKTFREFQKIEKGKNIDEDLFQKFKYSIKNTFLENGLDFFRLENGVIIPQNYIGAFLLDNVLIEILPKIVLNSNKIEEKKRIIELLNETNEINIEKLEGTSSLTEDLPILEIYISQFINEVFKITKKGLLYSYKSITKNSHSIKGKLNIREQIRVNVASKEKFMVTYDEFSINSIENILIKICLIKLKEISRYQENIENLKKLLHIFSQVEIEHTSSYYLKQLYNNRKNFYYKRVLELVEFFLKRQEIYFGSDVGTSIESLFFPMEMVYENYISNKIKKMISFKYSNLKIKLQDRKKFLFQDFSINDSKLENKNNFRIIPDIVIENNDKKEIFILDTKWKKLTNDEKINYNISQEDIYQMIVYVKGYSLNIKKQYNCKKAFLIYPSTDELKEKKTIMYGNFDFQVYIIFVNLSSDRTVENDLKGLFEILINENYFKEE